MKVLGISAGRRNGGNDGMCIEALMGAKEQGAEVEFIHLLDLDIKHCTGCISCVMAQFNGKGNLCVLKDDFEWLLDKMYDADGIIFSIPIFEKGAAGIFHTLMDRFGPRMGRSNNIIANDISLKSGGEGIDPRYFKERVVSYMGIGGSDWTTRVQCDFGIHALTPMWKVIDNEVFGWSKGILGDEGKVARAHEIGINIAKAAMDIEHASYQGEPGVCPHCHSREFFIDYGEEQAICCQCGIVGTLKVVDGKIAFEFPKEQIKHAHDTLEGQFIHSDDIKENEGRASQLVKTEEYQNRVKTYKEFIRPLVPQRN